MIRKILQRIFSFYSSYFFEVFLKFIRKENYFLFDKLNENNKIFDYISSISNFPKEALSINKQSFFWQV
ncbi:hypothetical protein BGC07_05725 [Piscirickettsia litoralis]|uniref:Uncharacterized protein n=1 Tax=Piscirickettsia litoralis TaxID=1891921 RepID=A0ABX3A527_9GAMM|nr:hypothetical protein BGC07_05725 [Piscirickettsia litoralis]